MSDTALLNAVERRLRETFGDADGKFVGVQPGCQPPPTAGEHYVGIDSTGWKNSDTGPLSLDETYGILVVVTWKLAAAPADRRAARIRAANQLNAKVLAVRAALHGSYAVLGYANDELGDAANGFIEPLTLRTVGPVAPKGPDWVWATTDHPPTVYAREVRFDGARRVQTLESMG